jgi:hypothetical protein
VIQLSYNPWTVRHSGPTFSPGQPTDKPGKTRRFEDGAASNDNFEAEAVIREVINRDPGSIAEQKTFIRSLVSRVDVDFPSVELKYTCPLVPPGGVAPLSNEVLCIEKEWLPRVEEVARALQPGVPC